MTGNPTAAEIKASTLEWLKDTPFAADSIEPLTGGTANFIYRAHLRRPLEDGTAEVVIKHGEGFIANSPAFQLSTNRCAVEVKCLKAFEGVRAQDDPEANDEKFKFVVRTPKCYTYDEASNTQIQESMPKGLDLKTYVIKNFPSPTPETSKDVCLQLGKSLAEYITSFHKATAKDVSGWNDRGRSDPKPEVYTELEGHRDMQALKHMINYDWLLQRVDTFPEILGDAKPIFEKVKKLAQDELKGDLLPIHGDFWTGNILLSDVDIQRGIEMPISVIDWEMAQLGVRALDHGQMLAEMYMLWLYKKIDAGLWLVQGYAAGLGPVDEELAWRTAIQIGCHLLCFGVITPGWGTEEQVKQVASIGRDIIVNAWNRDREWLEGSDLACLFGLASSDRSNYQTCYGSGRRI